MKYIALIACFFLASPVAAQNITIPVSNNFHASGTPGGIGTGNDCGAGFGVNAGFIATLGMNAVWTPDWCAKMKIFVVVCIQEASVMKRQASECPAMRSDLIATKFSLRSARCIYDPMKPYACTRY